MAGLGLVSPAPRLGLGRTRLCRPRVSPPCRGVYCLLLLLMWRMLLLLFVPPCPLRCGAPSGLSVCLGAAWDWVV